MQKPIEKKPTRKKLWSPLGVGLVSLVLSPLVGMLLYIFNYHRSGDYQRRNLAIMGYIAVSMGVLAAVFWLPVGFKFLLYAIHALLGGFFYWTQRELYDEHVREGGKQANWIIPGAIGIAIAALFIYLMAMFSSMPERNEHFYNDELFYNVETTPEERAIFVKYLESVGFFGNDKVVVQVKLERTEKGLNVGFAVPKIYWNDPEALKYYQSVQRDLESGVFPGEQVTLQLTDNIFRVKKSIE